MPKKPIQPDRVRVPKQWWRARFANVGGGLLALGVIFIGVMLYNTGFGFWLVFPPVLGIMLAIWFLGVRYETIVHRAWIKRVIEHGGLMCPQCAYPLSGIQRQRLSITCPECGYFTNDARRLFERWRSTMKSFYWSDDKRLRNHSSKEPGD